MSKGKLLAVSLVWLTIVAALALGYRYIYAPNQARETIARTSSTSNYRASIQLGLDASPGNAILRSKRFREELAGQKIRLMTQDGGGDDVARLRGIQAGDIHMAAFTIDALLAASGKLGELPATIVAILDESRGADAVVAARKGLPNVDALNNPAVRFVLVSPSPSETLTRVIMSHFRLQQLSSDPFVLKQSPEDLLAAYREAKPGEPLAFVTWEPHVSQLLANPEMRVLADTGSFRGYVVNVLVVSRDFLIKNEDVVRDVVGSYFRVAYEYRDRMRQLLIEDAAALGTPLPPELADRLVQSIWWKNTLENFAHFGIDSSGRLQLLEDMISNLTSVLVKTGGLRDDPTGGEPGALYLDRILRQLHESNFHPGLPQESVRDDQARLASLSDEDWNRLEPIGTLAVPDLVFARGTDRLTEPSRRALEQLAKELESFPNTYLVIRGHAAGTGNAAEDEVYRALALRRAEAAAAHLLQQGIDPNRVRAVPGAIDRQASVSFLLGRPPY